MINDDFSAKGPMVFWLVIRQLPRKESITNINDPKRNMYEKPEFFDVTHDVLKIGKRLLSPLIFTYKQIHFTYVKPFSISDAFVGQNCVYVFI